MSTDAPGFPAAAVRDLPDSVVNDTETEATWAETIVTFAAATVAVVTVTFVGVLMAMA